MPHSAASQLGAAAQQPIHRRDQLVDRHRTVGVGVHRRADVDVGHPEDDVHALDQLVDGDGAVLTAVTGTGLR